MKKKIVFISLFILMIFAVKSYGANLQTLRLNIEGIVPNFDPDILEYYILVDENTEELDITAIPEANDADVEIKGNKDLEDGLNIIEIVVSQGDDKTEYIINVTKTDKKEKANTNLTTLAVENYDLSPEYSENMTVYNLEVGSDEEKLSILAIPENMNSSVEIRNNEKLEYGENTVEIIVTAPDGVTTRKYILNVYKRNEQEQIASEESLQNSLNTANAIIERTNSEIYLNEDEKDNNVLVNRIFMIVGSLISLCVLVIVIVRIKKK